MKRPEAPGKLYDIGGYRLHLQKQGTGRPVAVLDTGLGGNSLIWANALPAVARVTEACTFDRAGSGWSDPAPDGQRRTSQQLVEEQRRLLKAAGLEPPYILVGHSSGAIHSLVYAKRYPAEVAGMVLVEPSHPDMFTRAPQVPGARPMSMLYGGLAGLRHLGLLGWVGPAYLRAIIPNGARTLPAAAWNGLLYFASQGQDYRTASLEAAVADESFADAHCEPGGLGALPLVVLTAEWWVSGKPNALKKTFYPLRQEMPAFSTAGWHEIVSGTDHTDLPIARPEVVAQAVQAIIELSRSSKPA